MQEWAGAVERVYLSYGWRVCSAKRVRLSMCSYRLAHVRAGAIERAVFGGLNIWQQVRTGALVIWPAFVQRKAGALEHVLFIWRT